MWLFAKDVGFLSVVQHDKDATLVMARGRKREHLAQAFPTHEDEIESTPKADYAWRVTVPREHFVDLMVDLALDLDYTTNVKGEVSKGDQPFHDAMLDCWETLVKYQDQVDRAREFEERAAEEASADA